MKRVAEWALGTAQARGASYAEARVVHERDRSLATKNGKIATASSFESMGAGIRVIAGGGWGFAATEDLTREGVERCAAEATAIARASATVKERPLELVPEAPAKADWSSPCKIDPFTTSVDDNLQLLMKIDEALRGVQGVTLAEANLNFRRTEQWFYNTEGSDIHQTRYHDRRGLCRSRICRQRNPETLLSEFFRRAVAEQGLRADRRVEAVGECAAHRRRMRGAAQGGAMSRGTARPWCWILRRWDCRFTSRSAIRSNSIACWHGSEFRRNIVSHAR